MNSIVVIGSGGHANSIIDIIDKTPSWKIEAIVGTKNELGKKILNYEVNYTDEDIQSLLKISKNAVLAIGQLPKPDLRKKIKEKYKEYGFNFPNIISENAYISKFAKIEEGVTVGHGAILNSNSVVGEFTIVNSRALIEHDVVIGKFCHISTGSIINGHTKIGDNSFIGSSSTLRENLYINSNTIIGAGQTVMYSSGNL